MEPEKVAPEAISAPIPDDLKARYRWLTNRPIWTEMHTPAPYSEEQLIERIASMEQQLAALKAPWGIAESIADELGMSHKCTGTMCYTCAKIRTLHAALARAREVQK